MTAVGGSLKTYRCLGGDANGADRAVHSNPLMLLRELQVCRPQASSGLRPYSGRLSNAHILRANKVRIRVAKITQKLTNVSLPKLVVYAFVSYFGIQVDMLAQILHPVPRESTANILRSILHKIQAYEAALNIDFARVARGS